MHLLTRTLLSHDFCSSSLQIRRWQSYQLLLKCKAIAANYRALSEHILLQYSNWYLKLKPGRLEDNQAFVITISHITKHFAHILTIHLRTLKVVWNKQHIINNMIKDSSGWNMKRHTLSIHALSTPTRSPPSQRPVQEGKSFSYEWLVLVACQKE